jgi:hypothetical protein
MGNIAEVGIQSAINPSAMLTAMLDETLPRAIHYRVARLYFEAVIWVQIPVDGLSAKDSRVWTWLRSFPAELKYANDTLRKCAGKIEIANAVCVRQRSRHAIECVVPALTRFLLVYYVESNAPEDWKKLLEELQTLLKQIQALCEQKSQQLGAITETVKLAHDAVADCLTDLGKYLMPSTPMTPLRNLRMLKETVATQKTVSVLFHRHESMKAQQEEGQQEGQQEEHQRRQRRRNSLMSRNVSPLVDDCSLPTDDCSLPTIAACSLVADLSRQPETMAYRQSGMQRLVKYAVCIPLCSQWLSEKRIRELGIIRLEPLLGKLVRHTTGLIQTHGDRKLLLVEHVPSTVWLLRLFRHMIEEKWKFGVEDRDEKGSEESDRHALPIINALEGAHTVRMCIDLVAKGLDKEVVWEATRLLVTMLFVEGGNRTVQQTMHAHFEDSSSEMFFFVIREMLAQIVTTQKNESDGSNNEDAPKELWILALLQLSCEGHYIDNQEVLREQPKNEHTVNLLDDMVLHFQELCNLTLSTPAPAPAGLLTTTKKFASLILEVIQGPCKGNQIHFAQHTPLVETMNRAMRLSAGELEQKTTKAEKKQAARLKHDQAVWIWSRNSRGWSSRYSRLCSRDSRSRARSTSVCFLCSTLKCSRCSCSHRSQSFRRRLRQQWREQN